MNEFNSIYYLHIPKTAGRWYIRAVNGPVVDILTTKKNNLINISAEKSKLSQSTHWGWIPEIDKKTFIHTTIREPVSHICSLFTHRHIGHPKWFDNKIFIEKMVWHRVIKGDGNLELKIKKLSNK